MTEEVFLRKLHTFEYEEDFLLWDDREGNWIICWRTKTDGFGEWLDTYHKEWSEFVVTQYPERYTRIEHLPANA